MKGCNSKVKKMLQHLVGISLLIALCSCSLPQSVEWGDCLAEVDIGALSSGSSWSSSELQSKNNAFCMTIRGNKNLPTKIKDIKLANGQTFMIETIDKNYYWAIEDNNEKKTSVLRCQNKEEKILWERQFNSPSIIPDYIYNRNNNLLFAATLLLNEDYDPDYILLLDTADGRILKKFTFDKMIDPQSPWSIDMSDNLDFLIMTVPIQRMSLQKIHLIFRRIQEENHFKYIGYLHFPQDGQDGFIPDGIRINNDVAIISMQKGQRDSLVATQKIVFFDLRSNSMILEYRFVANAIIHDAVITADRKYVAFIIYDSPKSKRLVRLYKLLDKTNAKNQAQEPYPLQKNQ